MSEQSTGVFRASISEDEKYLYHLKYTDGYSEESVTVRFQNLNEAMNKVKEMENDNSYKDINVVRSYDNHLIWSENDSPNMKFYGSFDRDHWQALTHIDRKTSENSSVYFDIDGTLGYWYQDTRGMVYPDQVLDPKSHYFRNIASHPFMIDLAKSLFEQGIDVCIVSAADNDTIRDKYEWIKEHCPFIDDDNIFFCPLGADKTHFIKGNADKSILIDDYKGNLDKWSGISVKAINSINSVDDRYICVEGYKAEQDLSKYEIIMNKAVYDIKTALGMEGRTRVEPQLNKYEQIINDKTQTSFAIYQVKDNLPEDNDISYMSLAYIQQQGMKISKDLYDCVYASATSSSSVHKDDFLDKIYYDFNARTSRDIQENFKGRSVSMSDVIVINDHGDVSAYYVDSIGFKKLDNFLVNIKDFEAVKNLTNQEKIEAAKQGLYLDALVKDPNPEVKIEVARQGRPQDLQELSKDKSISVKVEVIKQGYQSEELINDDSWIVKCMIAKQGRPSDLEILKNDEDARVRAAVVNQGYAIDTLMTDDDPTVLVAVAEHGDSKHLDYLLKKNPIAKKSVEVKCAIADRGYGLDVLSNDDNIAVKIRVNLYKVSHKDDASNQKNQKKSKSDIENNK